MNIAEWKLSRDSVAMAQILTFLPGVEQVKVVSKAIDGTVHIQTIGTGVKHASVSILANREELALVNAAEADGAVVAAVYRGVRYLGYIESAPEWETKEAGAWYTADIKLLIEEEVSV